MVKGQIPGGSYNILIILTDETTKSQSDWPTKIVPIMEINMRVISLTFSFFLKLLKLSHKLIINSTLFRYPHLSPYLQHLDKISGHDYPSGTDESLFETIVDSPIPLRRLPEIICINNNFHPITSLQKNPANNQTVS